MHDCVELNWTGLNRTDSTSNLCIGDSLSLLVHLSQRKRWVKEEEQRYTMLYCTILYCFTARHHWDGSSCLSLLCSSSSLDHFPQFLSCPLIPPLTSPQVSISTLKLYHLTRSLCTDYWQWRGFDRPFLRIHYLGRGGSSGHSQRENRSEVQPTQRHW